MCPGFLWRPSHDLPVLSPFWLLKPTRHTFNPRAHALGYFLAPAKAGSRSGMRHPCYEETAEPRATQAAPLRNRKRVRGRGRGRSKQRPYQDLHVSATCEGVPWRKSELSRSLQNPWGSNEKRRRMSRLMDSGRHGALTTRTATRKAAETLCGKRKVRLAPQLGDAPGGVIEARALR